MTMRCTNTRVWLSLSLLAIGSGAAAQTAPPTLQMVSPTGAQRGTTATVTITGTNIADPTRIIFSEPGFTAKVTAVKEIPFEKPMTPKGVVRTDAPIEDKARRYELTATISIAPGVPHAVHAFRLETPLGVSNLLRFAVSSLPETAEREPNAADEAQKVSLPGALVGALTKPGDVDGFAFRARAGEEMVFQVVARPIGSRLDSILRLRDAKGNLVAENNDIDLNRDSTLTWRFTQAGTYTLTIEDIEHGGAATGFNYRIYAGALPYVAGLFPLGVPSGSTSTVTVTGVNLGATREVKVVGDPAALVGRTIPVAVSTPAGSPLNRKAVALGTYPEVLESEPNSDSAVAQKIMIPSTVNGRIWTPPAPEASAARVASRVDEDVFAFTARKGQKLVFDVTAQQLGSPLDSILEILDANGRVVPRALVRCLARTEIALNDPDSNRRGMRLLTWNELAINDYLLVGDEMLQVAAMPTHPDDDLLLKSFRGVREPLLDTSARNHFVGEPVYKVEIHPIGARLEPNGMPVFQIDYVNDDGGMRFGGKDSRLHFEAPADGQYFVRLRDVRGMEGERFAYRLAVREPAPDFEITFDPKSFTIPRGGRVSVIVTVERRDGFDGPIDVELRDLPPGLTATAGRIPAGAATTVLMVAAPEDASLSGHKVALRSMAGAMDVAGFAALKVVGRAEINGRTVTREYESLEPLSLVALGPKPDLVVTTEARRIELAPGGQVALTINVERHNGFTARVPISVMNLPHGVRVDDIGLNGVMITEAETSRTIHIVAEPWVSAQSQPLLVVGRVEVNSPLRNEHAALPVELVIKPAITTTASR
jgi:hypothetical protein